MVKLHYAQENWKKGREKLRMGEGGVEADNDFIT